MLDQIDHYVPPGAKAAIQRYLSGRQPDTARSRPVDNVIGKEVVTQSSKNPLVVNPLLEATPMELSKHRSDTHIRVAHGTSNVIAYATGFFDGVVDSLVNGTAEIVEDGVFFVSKVFHGTKHGWARGKFPNNYDQ